MTHTTERVHVTETPGLATPESPKSSTSTVLGWAAILLGLVTATILAVAAFTSDPAPPPTAPEPTSVEQGAPLGVPQSADGAEQWLAGDTGAPLGVPQSADGAEQWLADTGVPPGVPRSADGAERSLADGNR